MPISVIKKKSEEDKFYTKPSIAQMCVDFLQSCVVEDDLSYIEPSAGNGSFSKLIPCTAYDLKPEEKSIKEQDWLQWTNSDNKNWVMFGNPPFGNRNTLSKAFIKKGIEEGCSYIGFVLPNSFKKLTTQRVFPTDWKLIGSVNLPSDSFLLNGEDYNVPCVFQVWSNSVQHTEDYRELKGKEFTQDFSFTNKLNGDLFIFGASPTKWCETERVLKNNRGYYLKLNIEKSIFLNRLNKVNWKANANSTVNGGVAWYSKDEIIKIWEKYYGCK